MTLYVGPRSEPGRYRIHGTQPLPGGTGGVTWRATRRGTDVEVALKQLNAVPEEVSLRGDVLAAIGAAAIPGVALPVELIEASTPSDDPTASTVFDTWTVVTRWETGIDLVEASRDTDATTALRWLPQVAESVAALHDLQTDVAPAGFLHLDVRPPNVRVRPDGKVVLLDLDDAHPRHLPWTGVPAGDAWCPFELRGRTPASFEVSTASDGWMVAALGYWLLLGEPPGQLASRDAATLLEVAARNAGVKHGPKVAGLLAAMLHTDPAQRPAIRPWAADLRAALDPKPKRWWIPAVAAGIAVIGLGAVALGRDDDRGGAPAVAADGTIELTVSNLVTNGPVEMREDVANPLVFADAPTFPADELPGGPFATGDTIAGFDCYVAGQPISNGVDGDPSDDDNPDLFSSPFWYSLLLEDGTRAFVSEVWIDPEQRGGLDLPTC